MIDQYGICLNLTKDLIVQGKASDEVYELISYRLRPCSLDDKSSCANYSTLKKLNFYWIVPKTSYNPADFENPYNIMPNADEVYYLNPSIFQSYRVTIQTTSVNDFIGLISRWTERQ